MRCLFIIAFLLYTYTVTAQQPVLITYAAKQSNQPLDGRLLLMLSNNNRTEPRFQVVDGPQTQLAFGIDVENWKAGESKTVTAAAFGYPIQSLAQVPPGEY